MEIQGTCDNPKCTVSTDGKCYEGLSLEQCHYFSLIYNDIEEQNELGDSDDNSSNFTSEKEEYINIHSGKHFSIDESTIITRNNFTKFIVIIGAPDSGKTTLLASLYDSFQTKPFAGYLFAGSYTLQEFEKISHLSRLESEREIPETERTKIDFDGLLHLSVRPENLEKPSQHIILTDLSGERYNLGKDDTAYCQENLKYFEMADRFILIIDGEKISTIKSRQQAYWDAKQVLQSFLDANILSSKSILDIVISKWDLIENLDDDNKQKVDDYIEHIENDYTNSFSSFFSELNLFKIAGRPEKKTATIGFAYGLDKILPLWVEKTTTQTKSKNNNMQLEREFNKFSYKFRNKEE